MNKFSTHKVKKNENDFDNIYAQPTVKEDEYDPSVLKSDFFQIIPPKLPQRKPNKKALNEPEVFEETIEEDIEMNGSMKNPLIMKSNTNNQIDSKVGGLEIEE